MLLRARTVLPVCSPPIDNGAVLVWGERIEAVGRFRDLRRKHSVKEIDLGAVILLPGLINAHCHLDYTGMAGQLSPTKNFSDWIKGIVSLKAQWSYSDFAQSWLNGAAMLLRSGTTTVVDIESVPELLPEVTTSTGLDVISCIELLSVRSRDSARQMVNAAIEILSSLPAHAAGLSPHAPYTTTPELLRMAATAARECDRLLTMHVAESADEFEMYQRGCGAMFGWLKSQRDMSDCDGVSPIAHLARHGVLSPKFLAVHANYLAPGDAKLLGRSRSSVVHCPRSHAFFRHAPFPLAEMDTAGVNVCLGTDSMATMSKLRGEPFALNLFSEMRVLANSFPALKPKRILEMVTVNAAKALGRPRELGRLATGARADLIAVPHRKSSHPHRAVLDHRGDVSASMIRGAWVAPVA